MGTLLLELNFKSNLGEDSKVDIVITKSIRDVKQKIVFLKFIMKSTLHSKFKNTTKPKQK